VSVHDALPGDIYVDDRGKLWRCMVICNEPTRTFEEVERRHETGDKDRINGGVGGLTWNGWRRIWRKEEPIK